MGSARIPKLVIKRQKSTRRLKLPDEMAADQQEGRVSTRSRRITQATVAVRRAKTTVRSHAYLVLIGLCATVVMYGIVASISPSEKTEAGPAAEESAMKAAPPPGFEQVSAGVSDTGSCVWQRDKDDPEILLRITTSSEGTKIERFREIKLKDPDGKILMPLKPEKPKPFMPTIEKKNKERQWTGTIPQ